MKRDADKMRDGGPTLFTSVRNNEGVEGVLELIKSAWENRGAGIGKKQEKLRRSTFGLDLWM